MAYFKNTIMMISIIFTSVALFACSPSFASLPWDVQRTNVQACGSDAGVSASGFTVSRGEVHQFVTQTTADKYDFSCKSPDRFHVLPADFEIYSADKVAEMLADTEFTDTRFVMRGGDGYCSEGDASKLDADAAKVGSRHDTVGCYLDDGIAGSYDRNLDVALKERAEW